MDSVQRYVMVPAVLNDETKEVLPIWDEKLKYVKGRGFSYPYLSDGDNILNLRLVEGVFDLKKKTLSLGEVIDIYPKNIDYVIGDDITREVRGKRFYHKAVKVDDILFEEYDIEVMRGSKVSKYYGDDVGDRIIEPKKLYCVHKWLPLYVLSDGHKTKWGYELSHVTDLK